MTESRTYREKRREDSVKKYLNGEARRPYILREDIARGLEARIHENIEALSESSISSSCICQQTLGQFSDMFKNMLHTGRKLVNRASIQQPKTASKRYRNITQQNKWLLENVFDSYGNYIFCFSCIKNILEVGGKRLHRLRDIKRQQVHAATIHMRKHQVARERICDVVPPVHATNVLAWWMSLEDDSVVELRSPPKLHRGTSHYRKEELLPRFLDFIDHNSQSNGRRAKSPSVAP